MEQKKKILLIFGTRPEAIKMAPLVKALQADEHFDALVAVTAQHREMLDQVLDCFAIKPDFDLNMMQPGQTLAQITSRALNGLQQIIAEQRPDLVLVHGDTTTTLAGALAAFYEQVPVGHVEAGLRTGDKYAPYPEEMNRRLTSQLTDFHFAPTGTARDNLLREGTAAERIFVTGNTVIDALLQTVDKGCDLAQYLGAETWQRINWEKKLLLLTCHRRENWGQPMQEIFAAVNSLAGEFHESVEIVCPVHKNPLVRQAARQIMGAAPNIHLIEPLDYRPFAQLMSLSSLVVTDSGGMQEEAPALGKPVLVLREVTERPEAVAAGTVRLIGNRQQSVYDGIRLLLTDDTVYSQMAHAANPYGDGKAARYIRDILQERL